MFFKQNFPCSGSPYVLWSLSTTCFLHVVVFLPHRLFFPHTGLLPFRPASNSCSSSAASPAPSSGGFRQHRTSCPPKRPTSTPRACRGEFSSLRLINLAVNDSYNVNHGKKIYPCYLKRLLKMLYDFRTCCTTGSRRDPEFKS